MLNRGVAPGASTRLLVFFADMSPMLIHKDVGQIPYYLAREHGWQCTLAFCRSEGAPLLAPDDYDQRVTRVLLGMKVSRARIFRLFATHLAHVARETDVLLLYHLTPESIAFAALYKALNPTGVAILKLDMDSRGVEAFERPNDTLRRSVLIRLLARAPFDLATIETTTMLEALRPHFASIRYPLRLLPIGFACVEAVDLDELFARKEKIIITAGRLGYYQKHNELLLDAIERIGIEAMGGWQVWLVGDREASLESRIQRFREDNPEMVDVLVVRDFVASREELYGIYKRASVYCLTSRWESFAIVLAEALYYGCFLVSTNVGAASDVTEGGRHGDLVPVDDVEALTTALRRIVTGERAIEPDARASQALVSSSFTWGHVAGRFAGLVADCRADSASANASSAGRR